MNLKDFKVVTGRVPNLRKDMEIAQSKLLVYGSIYESTNDKTAMPLYDKSRKQMANFLESVLHPNFNAKTLKAKYNFLNEFYKGLEKVSKDRFEVWAKLGVCLFLIT